MFEKLDLGHFCLQCEDMFYNKLFCIPQYVISQKGLERHEGEQMMTGFSFWGELSHLICKMHIVDVHY